jgi:proteasome lid subunit RPN8/RPN11
MKADQPGFVGIFHVHNDGSEPSFADVQESSRIHIPYLVVSATPDYQQSGVKLYLVHAGAFELLYQGPLKPKQ